ncbi:par-3 family cell polarity regulator beta a isoform X2 [Amphiprion ocellaris]|uniref:par-3 family cell polarity regulator beta a isoform X2 n=1 Tax=Amphiprion ocellaris TaxID=80972 RepID=UPI002410E05C|nr:par-3 family cell polarity regulator beta a isoform X2 [Amphiprion ocellaris]
MKVTVTFRDTAVVVPCKAGWTVRDLIDQATRRYHRVQQQHGDNAVKTHHLEYTEGGILDMDDLLSDLVEDRDKLVAVFHEVQPERMDSPRESMSNGYSSAAPSPEPVHYYSHLQSQEPGRGEIEVNEAILKANTPLMVRSSSDSALAPPYETTPTPPPDDQSNGSPEPEINNVLKGALDRLNTDDRPTKMSQVNYSALTRTVEFLGHQGPLGIHVVPYCSSLSGRTLGLHIKGIEENSRSKRENIFKEDEAIVQINDTPLQDKTFTQSQEVFRQAMSSSSVRLEVLPAANKPRYEKSLIGQLFTGDGKDTMTKSKSPMLVHPKADSHPELKLDPKVNAKSEVKRPDSRAKTPEPAMPRASPVELQSGPSSLERVSPTPPSTAASSSPIPRTDNQSPLTPKSPVFPGLANLTNKKGGKRMKIDLKKGTEGLGFTVVTRDSTIHGPGPILVKNILPRGAAIKDGRLQPGDRILEVNGVDMTGRSQEELVAMLRSTKQGENVCVVVARQEDIFLPRELKGEEAGSLVLEDGREQLMYEIPLNETGSAGLGISLKGNKSRETGEDLGIFIKSIIHGGAAYKDGRLSVNDQLIAVNGESLLGRSNHTAMETLRSSMSSEGNARGTIQLVVLRMPRQGHQMRSASPLPSTNVSAAHQPNIPAGSSNQEPRVHDAYQRPSGPSRPPSAESPVNDTMTTNNYAHNSSGSAPYPAAATNGGYGHYGNNDEEPEKDFPPPPSPGAVEEMNRDLPLTPPHPSEFHSLPHTAEAFYANSRLANDKDNVPRNRASKSMDLVADESNVGSLVEQRNEPSAGGALGPTLGLWKSSSLESLQTAMSEVKQSHIQAQVPFHRPRPHMVRGRGCNQSFRIAIDKSYDGPSEDDDDLSEHSSGHETAASSSSRQGLDEDGKKKKKTKPKKKDKKSKGKKKAEDSVDDPEKKTKKKGFGLLRFGKKKEDKSKDAAKTSKSKLEALSEEELDRIPDSRDGYDPRYAEIHSGHVTPDPASFPDVEDDDCDPNYARINNFRQPPSPRSFISRTPSPAAPIGGPNLPRASSEELDGLYAKVNKSRPPPALQNQAQADSDQRVQGLRREYQQARAAPAYEELEVARRRVLEYDPNRMAPRGAESCPEHRYEEVDRRYPAQPRRDPYDYPTHSRPVPRDVAPYPSSYHDPPAPSYPVRVPLPQSGSHSQQAPGNPRYYPSSPHTGQQHRAAVRQDVPPSPGMGRRGRQRYGDGYRQPSPGRYASPDRFPDRYQYEDGRQPDPRRKSPAIGAV